MLDAVPTEEGTALIGRSAELAELAGLLSRTRLVTIAGAGGVGKTRLALRSAERATSAFPDGVRVVELSALRDPGLLAETVAAGLGLPEQDTRPRTEIIVGYLAERELLLILDTCEHLVEECALFAEAVLAEAPRITILATSRQPLDAAGEQVFPLGPLTVPDDPREPAAQSAEDGAEGAVELFERRAAAAVPGFTVTDGNRADVIGVCRQLDGIPLAIELAAAQLRTLPLADLAGWLGGQRVLRDSIGWSYELCDPAERLLWERASVFAGPFGIDALEQVCAGVGLGRDILLNTVFGLIDKSVLLRTSDDDPLYRMLDTVREYGAERLAASGTQPEVRARLVGRYLALAEGFDASPLTGQLDQYRALRREHANIRAAFDYACDRPGQEAAATRLAVSLHWYWQISGLLREGCYWLTRVLDLDPGTSPSPERARVLGLRGFLAAYGGEGATSLDDTSAAVEMAAEVCEMRLIGRAWLYHVRALLTVGRLEEAEEAGHKAATLLEGAGDTTVLPILDVMLAFKYWAAGELEACLARCDSGLRRLPVDLGERWASGYLLGLTGLAMFARGERERGSASTRRAMAMKAEVDDTAGIAYGLGTLAMMAADEGRFERVTWLLGAADPLWNRLGSVLGGTPELAERTRQITVAARDALGEPRYTRLRRTAAQVPLDLVVALAVEDTDEPPAVAPPR